MVLKHDTPAMQCLFDMKAVKTEAGSQDLQDKTETGASSSTGGNQQCHQQSELAKLYHKQLVADKAKYNKFMYRLGRDHKQMETWKQLKSSSSSTSKDLEEFVHMVLESGGKHGVSSKKAFVKSEEKDLEEGWMSFTEATALDDPIALEDMIASNTIQFKMNPNLSKDTNVPWPRCLWVYMTKEKKHNKQRAEEEESHNIHYSEEDINFAEKVDKVHAMQLKPGLSITPQQMSTEAAASTLPTPSTRDNSVLNNIRK